MSEPEIMVLSTDTEDNNDLVVNNDNNNQEANNNIDPIDRIFDKNLEAELETNEAMNFIYLGKSS